MTYGLLLFVYIILEHIALDIFSIKYDKKLMILQEGTLGVKTNNNKNLSKMSRTFFTSFYHSVKSTKHVGSINIAKIGSVVIKTKQNKTNKQNKTLV